MTKPEKKLYRYSFGAGAVYDERRESLTIGGRPVPIAPRQRGLLSALLRQDGVLAREDLLDLVWGSNPDFDTHLVDVAVQRLRKALGADAASIETVPRSGYRFAGPVVREEVGRELPVRLNLAAGAAVPRRPGFVLVERLAASDAGEVWLGQAEAGGERRVYKFALHRDRLRELKREYRLAQAAAAVLGPRDDLIRVISISVDETPYFLESEYGGPNLADWAASTQALAQMDRGERLALFLRIADAVTALHSVPVHHLDLKPANILVAAGTDGPGVRLVDFGNSRHPDLGTLLALTAQSVRPQGRLVEEVTRGTYVYMAPECLEGEPGDATSDVYSLGVLLFQIVVGNLGRRLESGWERAIDDPFLCEDIAAATDVDPAQRPPSVASLAQRLRGLADRRAAHDEQERQRLRDEAARAQALADRQWREVREARRPWVIAAAVALLGGLAVSLGLWRTAENARASAESAGAQARAVIAFLDNDVLGMSDPYAASSLVPGLRDPLKRAVAGVERALDGQPRAAAAVHAALAGLLYKYQDGAAEGEWKRSVELLTRLDGTSAPQTLQMRYRAAAAISLAGKFDEGKAWLTAVDRDAGAATDPMTRLLADVAWGEWYVHAQRPAEALPRFERALAAARRMPDIDAPVVDGILRNLTYAYDVTGRYDDAARVARELLEALRVRPGIGPLPVALAENALGEALMYQNKVADAAPFVEHAAQVVAERLGLGSPTGVMTRNALCELHTRRADDAGALDCELTLYAALTEPRATAPPWMKWAALGNAGVLQVRLQRAGDAVASLEQARDGLRSTLGEASGLYQMDGYYLAETRWRLGRGDEALRLLDTLQADQLRAGDPDAPWPERIALLRGLVLADQRKPDAARPLLADALDGLSRKTLPEPERLAGVAKERLAGLDHALAQR